MKVTTTVVLTLTVTGCQFLLGPREKAPPPPEVSFSPSPERSFMMYWIELMMSSLWRIISVSGIVWLNFRLMRNPPTLKVRKAAERVVVAAWAEPKALPEGGGEVQILVRAQKRGGAPYPGVEVRLQTSKGRLYSGNRILITDKAGRTRDRLSTRETVTITLNAGGTMYRFQVPVGPVEPE
jgi:hypothetical protein